MCVLGFQDHLALTVHLFLVGAHLAVARSRWFDLVVIGRCRAVLLALFYQTLRFYDLAAFELAVFIGLLQHVAQVFITVFGAGNLQRGGKWDGTALHTFNQTLFALIQQKDDVFDVLG